jgi:hypothetical protein
MDPLVIRFGTASGDLDVALSDLEETIDAHGGRTLTSWSVDDHAYAVVDVSAFIEDIDHVFSSIPVVFEAGAPIITDDPWIEMAGGLEEVELASGYDIDLPGFESPHIVAVSPPRAVCAACMRIGHRGPPCPA